MGALDKRGDRLENSLQQFAAAPRGRWKKAMRSIADEGLLKWNGQAGIEFVERRKRNSRVLSKNVGKRPHTLLIRRRK